MNRLDISIPSRQRKIILAFAYKIMQLASGYGREKWGMTYSDGIGFRI